MKLYPRVLLYLSLVVLFSASGVAWAFVPTRDGDPGTIGGCLTKPDSTTVTLPGVQVVSCGVSGKSFKIKEWCDKPTTHPRLVAISSSRLPVREFWNVTLTGSLHTVAADYGQQRVLIVSPANIQVLCDAKGRPVSFIPV